MERIREALNRAKNEQGNQRRERSQVAEMRVSRIGATSIEYNQTRVINVDKTTLLKNRVVAAFEDHEASGAYKILRTQVLRRMRAEGWNTLGITSAAPMEGKSITSVNLAVSLAQSFSDTVLLADLDLKRPSVSSFFDCRSPQGITDHLLNGVPVEELLFNPGIERLVVLPAGVAVRNSSELTRSSGMQALVNDLKTRYRDRILVCDLPPLLAGDDALSFLPCVDCVLMVIEDGRSHPDEVARAAELLQDSHLIGAVLNKCKDKKRHHYSQYY